MQLNELFEGYKKLEPAAVFTMPTTVFVSRRDTPEQEQRVDDIPKWAAANGINMSLLRLVLNPLNAAFGRPIKGWRFRLLAQPALEPYRKQDRHSRGLKPGKYTVQKVGSDLPPKIVDIRQWAKDNEISTADLVQAFNQNKPVRDGLNRKWIVKLSLDEAKKEALGDCFKAAGKNVIRNEVPGMILVHAAVTGQGGINGVRHAHAWNEIGDVVLDNSNNRNIIMRREQYYAIGKVDENNPGQYRRYSRDEALKWMVKTRNYGPWELDDDLAE